MQIDNRVSGKTRVMGIIGNPVEHSISPQLHNTICSHLGVDLIYVPLKVQKNDVEHAVKGLKAMDFVGFTLHMLAFCPGAILFYYLLYKSDAVPRALSLWGLITVVPLLVATVLSIFEVEVPFVVALPYVPFEFVIGVWILAKGTQHGQFK